MSARRQVVLWRHGQTAWNLEHRFQGKTDIPLDETGLSQAARSARLLAALRPAAIVSSDLRRARQTASALAELTDLTVTCSSDLRERDGGLWEGLTGPEIRERWPEEHARWMPPEGETSREVAERVAPAIRSAVSQAPEGGPLVIAGHGAALRLGMACLLGLAEEQWGLLGGLANCCWSVLEEGRRATVAGAAPSQSNGGWRLVEHNAGTLPEPVLSDDRTDNAA